MEFKVIDGCTCFSTTINGKELNEFSDEDAKTYLEYLIRHIEDRGFMESIIKDVITVMGKRKFLYHCEQCGDDVIEYNLEI